MTGRKKFIYLVFAAICFGAGYWFWKNYGHSIIQGLSEQSVVSTTDDPNTFNFDFENADEAYDQIEESHSGKFAARIKEQGYGAAFVSKVSDLYDPNSTRVGIQAWIKREDKSKFELQYVVSVEDAEGKSLFWDCIYAVDIDFVKGKWTKLNGLMVMTDKEFPSDAIIKVYPWNKGKSSILIDDVSITISSDIQRKGNQVVAKVDNNECIDCADVEKKFSRNGIVASEIYPTKNRGFALSTKKGYDEGTIADLDIVLSGNFMGVESNNDQLLIIKPGGKSEMFGFCNSDSQFVSVYSSGNKPQIVLTENSIFKNIKIPGSNKELILEFNNTKKILLLHEFSNSKLICGINSEVGIRSRKKNYLELGISHASNAITSLDGSLCLLYDNRTSMVNMLRLDKNGDVVNEKLKVNDQVTSKLKQAKILSDQMNKSVSGEFSFIVSNQTDSSEVISRIVYNDQKKYVELNNPKNAAVGKYSFYALDHTSDAWFKLDTHFRFDSEFVANAKEGINTAKPMRFVSASSKLQPKYYENTRVISGQFFNSSQTFAILMYNCNSYTDGNIHCAEFEEILSLPNRIGFFKIQR